MKLRWIDCPTGSKPRWLGWLLLSWFLSADVTYAIDAPPPNGPASEHVIADSTYDTTPFARSLDVNGTFAPFGSIYENGLRLRMTGSWSWYKFIVNDNPRTLGSGRGVEGDLLAGYGIVWPRVNLIGLIGPAFTESVDEGVRTTRSGVKSVVSFYARPTNQTMAYGQAFYSTISRSYQIQAKVGLKMPGNLYLGPEVKIAGSSGNAQQRVGAHLTALPIGPVLISLSGGLAVDREMGPSHYFSVNLYSSF